MTAEEEINLLGDRRRGRLRWDFLCKSPTAQVFHKQQYGKHNEEQCEIFVAPQPSTPWPTDGRPTSEQPLSPGL